MGYSTSSPPRLIAQAIGGGDAWWAFTTTDAATTVDGANYFTNGGSLGMKSGDHVISRDTDASPLSSNIHMVNATGDGSVDLNDGVAVTATDSD